MPIAKALVACLLCSACLLALAVDARERGFVREGMAESEVLLKIGRPDHEALVTNVRG